jgi:hypothetical protein
MLAANAWMGGSASGVSIGSQTGPRIGVQEGPHLIYVARCANTGKARAGAQPTLSARLDRVPLRRRQHKGRYVTLNS